MVKEDKKPSLTLRSEKVFGGGRAFRDWSFGRCHQALRPHSFTRLNSCMGHFGAPAYNMKSFKKLRNIMTVYTNFMGIDIGKFEVVVGIHGNSSTQTFENTPQGFKAFYLKWKPLLKQAFIVLETTGGYEKLFLESLLEKKVSVHRANTRQVKAFIHSLGAKAKTDSLDSKGLARYGFERHDRLALYKPLDKTFSLLQGLAQRRLDLTQILVSEKNRSQAPAIHSLIKDSCKTLIDLIQAQIHAVTDEMERIMEQIPDLKEKREILEEIPGIGKVTSLMLAVLLPELGHLNRREIASLVGLAPYPNESGIKVGYRRIRGGRKEVRNIIFMAGLSAGHSKSKLGDKYRKLTNAGKKKMVALVAIMRNIIVIANAKIKEHLSKKEIVAALCGKCA